jgi:hypothetical protein
VTLLGQREQKFKFVDQEDPQRFQNNEYHGPRAAKTQKAQAGERCGGIRLPPILFSYQLISYPY